MDDRKSSIDSLDKHKVSNNLVRGIEMGLWGKGKGGGVEEGVAEMKGKHMGVWGATKCQKTKGLSGQK